MKNIDTLLTETRNPKSTRLSAMSTLEMLTLINSEDATVAGAVRACLEDIAGLVDACHERMEKGGRVFYIGAGTSGRLGVLDASECPPTYGVTSDLFIGLIAGGQTAFTKAVEGAEDDEQAAVKDLQEHNLNSNDTVIGLAASGRTPYVKGGLAYAREVHALTAAIACVKNPAIFADADYKINPLTGPEVVTGSTRMKAGTAQKLILNMISTSLMVKAGKVYQNLMVDVQPTNEKLVDRAARIIVEATGCDLDVAKSTLKACHLSTKLAITVILSGQDITTCEEMLARYHDNVASVIQALRSQR